jgi:hypothetical protein
MYLAVPREYCTTWGIISIVAVIVIIIKYMQALPANLTVHL